MRRIAQKGLLLLVILTLIHPSGMLSGKAFQVKGRMVTKQDEAAIQKVIRQQIEAFQQDDEEAAFALASPGIRAKFRTAKIFMKMVREGYPPVYRPRTMDFLSLEIMQGSPVQILRISGSDGGVYQAFYPMELQPDLTWKTNGCFLLRTKETDI